MADVTGAVMDASERAASDFVDIDSKLVTTFVADPRSASDLQTRQRPPRVLPPIDARPRLGKYELLERVGVGGFGVVYRARCGETGREVALKALHDVDPSAVATLKNELRALAGVKHPNLVELYELGVDGETWFVAMEWVQGTDLVRFVRPDPDGPPHLPRLRVALAQLTLALAATHEAGFLHLDIKPSNVLVTPEGRVVLLDFGLAAHLGGSSALVGETRARGTPAFMAPEQVLGQELTEAADWYGLGGVLYLLLSGRLPYSGEHVIAIMAQKLLADPEPLEPSVCALDSTLAELAMDLLRRDPSARPSRAEILARLHLGSPSGAEGSRATIVGRDDELASLRRAFEAARDGRVVVHVRGRSGVGKSGLVSAFLAEVCARGDALVSSSRCFRQARLPYQAFDGCMDGVAAALIRWPEEEVAALTSAHVAELTRLFPALAQVPALARSVPERWEDTSPVEARRRAFAGLQELLTRVAGDRVLVLAIDDLQWSDEDSALLMTDLLRVSSLGRVLVVASYREDEAAGPVVRALPRASDGTTQVVHVDVAPLTEAEAAALSASLFGAADAERDLRLARQSRGVPLLLEELVERERTDAFLSTTTARDGVEVEDLILARLARVPPELRAVVELVSVAHRPVAPRVVAEALEETSVDVPLADVLASLGRYHLVRGDDQLEPYHDRTRASVLAQIHPDSLGNRHLTLARALERVGGADPGALAHHYRGAGRTSRAGEYALQAAAAAEHALAFGQAADYYADAARDLAATAPERLPTLAQARAVALGNAGRAKEAGDAFLACARDDLARGRELRRLAAEHYLTGAELDLGGEVLASLFEEVGLVFPKSRWRAIAGLVRRMAWLRIRGTTPRGAPTETAPTETVPTKTVPTKTVPIDERERIDLLLAANRGYANFSPILGGYFALEALSRSLRVGYTNGIVRGIDYYGLMTTYAGTERAARRGFRLIEQATALARKTQDPVLVARIGLAEGVAFSAVGRFADAIERLDETAVALSGVAGVSWERSILDNTCLQSLVWLGRLGEARSRVDVVLRRAEQTNDRFSLLIATVIEAKLALAAGRVDDARAQIHEVVSQWRSDELTFQHFFAEKTLVWCELYAGDVGAARRRVAALAPALARSGLLSVQLFKAEASFLEGCVELAAHAAGDADASLSRIDERARWLARTGRPYARGYAAMLRAGVARRKGSSKDEVSAVREASAAFGAAQMTLHAAATLLWHGESTAESPLRGEGVADPARWIRIFLAA